MMNRRHFLQSTAAATLANLAQGAQQPPKVSDDTASFFVVSDTHYLADEMNPQTLTPESTAVTTRLVEWLNKLPGTEFSSAVGGGIIPPPSGVIHGGDVIDSGDKQSPKHKAMQETEVAAFAKDFGLNGGDGLLKWPVYEIHGNHDGPQGKGPMIDAILARNQKRKGLAGVSKNGMHYSWDWNGVHFINLGIVVGEVKSIARKRRYAPMDSLEFLISDLAEKVGSSKRPVVITHHVDMMRYQKETPDEEVVKKEWDYADVQAYYNAIKGYNIAAIIYGHTHVRNVFKWDGGSKPVVGEAPGIPVFNTDNAAHFHSKPQAFLHFTISKKETRVREFATTDAWLTGEWKAQSWTFPAVV